VDDVHLESSARLIPFFKAPQHVSGAFFAAIPTGFRIEYRPPSLSGAPGRVTETKPPKSERVAFLLLRTPQIRGLIPGDYTRVGERGTEDLAYAYVSFVPAINGRHLFDQKRTAVGATSIGGVGPTLVQD
jgi:hypothetical protein